MTTKCKLYEQLHFSKHALYSNRLRTQRSGIKTICYIIFFFPLEENMWYFIEIPSWKTHLVCFHFPLGNFALYFFFQIKNGSVVDSCCRIVHILVQLPVFYIQISKVVHEKFRRNQNTVVMSSILNAILETVFSTNDIKLYSF